MQDSDGRARLAEEILKLSPADPDALSALAWYRFQRGEYAEAEHLFARLAQEDPGNKDYALGLAYARLNSGRLDTALVPFDRGLIAEDAETRSVRQQVYRKQAAEAYDSGQFDQAALPLENLLALDPTDEDAKELLAWTRYRQGRRDEARTLMEESFSAKPSPPLAAGLLGIYSASGDEDRAYGMAERLASDPDPGIRASTGPFFFDRGAPITAAQLDRDPERCFRNADSPRVETFLYHRSKQGDGNVRRSRGNRPARHLRFPDCCRQPMVRGRHPQVSFRQQWALHSASREVLPVFGRCREKAGAGRQPLCRPAGCGVRHGGSAAHRHPHRHHSFERARRPHAHLRGQGGRSGLVCGYPPRPT